jgi:hypothetical protein
LRHVDWNYISAVSAPGVLICMGEVPGSGSGHGTDYTDRLFRGDPEAIPVGAGEFCEIWDFSRVNVEDSGQRGCYTV